MLPASQQLVIIATTFKGRAIHSSHNHRHWLDVTDWLSFWLDEVDCLLNPSVHTHAKGTQCSALSEPQPQKRNRVDRPLLVMKLQCVARNGSSVRGGMFRNIERLYVQAPITLPLPTKCLGHLLPVNALVPQT